MRRLFADAFYWIALLHEGDQWHQRVIQLTETLDEHHMYTTDAVFAEYLATYSARGAYLRQEATATVRRLLRSPAVTVVPQTRAFFLAGLTLYEARPDKEYSLTDCISMHVMRTEGLTEVLTNDRHFTQEGFQILFQ
jgi:predicted nucleic acid-binding protein